MRGPRDLRRLTFPALLVLLLQVPTAATAQETGSFGLSVGLFPVEQGFPKAPPHMTGFTAWVQPVLTGPLSIRFGLRYASWGTREAETLPAPLYRGFVFQWYESDKVGGQVISLLLGPVLRLPNRLCVPAWVTVRTGLHFYRESRHFNRLPIADFGEPWPSRIQVRVDGVQAAIELGVRLALGTSASSPTLEISRAWNRRQWEPDEVAPATGPGDGVHLSLSSRLPLRRLDRSGTGQAESAWSRYRRGLGGAAAGLFGGALFYVCAQAAEGVENIGVGAYSDFIVLGGVLGSAVATTRTGERTPDRILSGIVGGYLAARIHSWFMRTRFGFEMPDPGLTITIPLGTAFLAPGG